MFTKLYVKYVLVLKLTRTELHTLRKVKTQSDQNSWQQSLIFELAHVINYN